MKNIAMIIAPKGFQDTEFTVSYKFFSDKGAKVDVFSTKKGTAQGKSGSSFNVNFILSELDIKRFDAIVFIGGPGTPIVRSDPQSERIAKDAFALKKTIGAICWSSTILAKAGILKGKKATVWSGDDPEFGMQTSEYINYMGGHYTGDPVTVDGNIITADGPQSAMKYAQTIWNSLEHTK